MYIHFNNHIYMTFFRDEATEKNKSNTSISKNSYCITLENAGKRTQGRRGGGVEGSSKSMFSGY